MDLNLLVVLDVLLRERSVTGAARQLHLTPSAVSHSLRRLREVFGDELLIRDGRRMRPTLRAEGLSETLPRVLGQLERSLAGPASFDAATSARTFRLCAPDFIAALLPRLLRGIGAAAPGVRVELALYTGSSVRDLAEGRHDALVAPAFVSDEGLRAEPLGSWPWTVYGRAGHPAFARWSLEAWAAHPHLQIGTSAARGPGPIGREAEALGARRTVGAVVPSFTMAPGVLAQTDMLLTVPAMAMGDAARAWGLARRELPFEMPEMGLSLFRSAAAGDEPGVRWFLDQVRAAAEHLG